MSTMTVAQAIQRAYTHATGHTDVLATNSAPFLRLLPYADSFQKDWQNESGVDWMSLYQKVILSGPITQGVAAYDIDTTIVRKVSQREGDSIVLQQITGANTGECWYYDVITPDKLNEYRYKQAASFWNQQIYFANSPENPIFPANDARLSAQITVPVFTFVSDIANPNGLDTVQVDDPMWMVYMLAAEFVRTDFVRQNQYPNLIALANERMQGMIQRNEDQRQEIPVDIDLFDIEPNTGLSSGAWY